MMSPILIIVNPNAAGGKAERLFESIKDRLREALGELIVAVSRRPEDLAGHIDAAAAAGAERLIAVGGDGTNHAVVNALLNRPDAAAVPLAFGSLPVGTGSDWARALGVPADLEVAVDWLARAQPTACDLGKVEYSDPRQEGRRASRIFLNIASAGVSGEVDARVNRARRRTAATFLRATVATLLKYRPQPVVVDCDGDRFYEGSSYLLAVANGRFFGRGMWIAPHALINDRLFDVVLVEGMPRLRILLALQTVFSGRHLDRKDVHSTRAGSVQVHSEKGPLSLDLDGEEACGQDVQFTVLPQALRILLHPAADKTLKKA
jgi:diacylglycerol kinase (ATP)